MFARWYEERDVSHADTERSQGSNVASVPSGSFSEWKCSRHSQFLLPADEMRKPWHSSCSSRTFFIPNCRIYQANNATHNLVYLPLTQPRCPLKCLSGLWNRPGEFFVSSFHVVRTRINAWKPLLPLHAPSSIPATLSMHGTISSHSCSSHNLSHPTAAQAGLRRAQDLSSSRLSSLATYSRPHWHPSRQSAHQ